MKIVWRIQATKDRTTAIDYIAERNVPAALGQLDEIERRTDLLADYPDLGRQGRRRGTRELVVVGTQFIIIYRINSRRETIEILRLLHGAQQWPPKR